MKTPTIVSRSDVRARSYQMGAAHERQAILNYVRRCALVFGQGGWNLADIIKWIEGRTKRFNAKKGGLGRRKEKA